MTEYPENHDGPANSPRLTAENERIVSLAIEKVRVPGVLMIVMSFFLMVHATLVVINSFSLDEQFAAQEEKIDNDPQFDAQKRQEIKEFMAKGKDVVKVLAPVSGVMWGVLCPLICVCAVKMMRLSSRKFAILGACLMMTPFTAGCCSILGLPIGIWALTALSNQNVKTAFEVVRVARTVPNPDGY